jgi:hypothetical protein
VLIIKVFLINTRTFRNFVPPPSSGGSTKLDHGPECGFVCHRSPEVEVQPTVETFRRGPQFSVYWSDVGRYGLYFLFGRQELPHIEVNYISYKFNLSQIAQIPCVANDSAVGIYTCVRCSNKLRCMLYRCIPIIYKMFCKGI